VKRMLAEWEREFPGRTETIFSAMRNLAPSHLADPSAFDFTGLELRRTPPCDGVGDPSDAEPWDEQ